MLGASYFYPSFSDRLYELNCLNLELESEIWGRKGLGPGDKDGPPVQADEKTVRAAPLAPGSRSQGRATCVGEGLLSPAATVPRSRARSRAGCAAGGVVLNCR